MKKKRVSCLLSMMLAVSMALGLALPAAAAETGEAGAPQLKLDQSEIDLGSYAPRRVGQSVDFSQHSTPFVLDLKNTGDSPIIVQSIDYEELSDRTEGRGVEMDLSFPYRDGTIAPGESKSLRLYAHATAQRDIYGSFTETTVLHVNTEDPATGETAVVDLPLTFSYEIHPDYEISQTEFDLGQFSTDEFYQPPSINGYYDFDRFYGSEYVTMTNYTDSRFTDSIGNGAFTGFDNNYITPSGDYAMHVNFSPDIDSGDTGEVRLSWELYYTGDEAKAPDTASLPTGKYTVHVEPTFRENDDSFDVIDHSIPMTFTFEIVPGTAQPGEPEEPLEPDLSVSPGHLDFGIVDAAAGRPAAETVTLRNTGNTELVLRQPTADHYEIGSLSRTTLAAGETATFTVRPEDGLEPGEYDETVTLSTNQDVSARLTLSYMVEGDSAVSLSTSALNFGTAQEGYAQPAARTVTVTNTGDTSVTLTQPAGTSFTVGPLSRTTLSAGQSAAFTVQPKAGLAAGTYSETISLRAGDAGTVTLRASFTVTGAQQPAPTFTDVTPDKWYYDFVETVAEKKLFAGNGDGTFAPEANMTYAEFLAVLFQFSGDTLPTNSGPNWYDNHIQWAKDHDLIPAGMLNGFDPEAAITRQDMAALFGSFLSNYDYTAAPVNSGTPSFSDGASIADYARDGVELCYQLGIMGGNDDGTFAPGNTAIRAEVAVTMVQMARVMGR